MKRQKRETKKERKARDYAQFGARPPAAPVVPKIPSAIKAQLQRVAGRVATALKARTEAGAIAAARAAAGEMDSALDQALRTTGKRRACAQGCSYCCKGLRVEVAVPEVVRIVDHLRSKLDAATNARIAERSRANAEQTHGKELLQYPVRLPCALLADDGACLAYEARPVACRMEHSMDAAECKVGHDVSTLGSDYPVPRIFELQVASAPVMLGTSQGVRDAVGDASPCELQEALHIALSDPTAIGRWLEGDDAFAVARVGQEQPPTPFVQLRRP